MAALAADPTIRRQLMSAARVVLATDPQAQLATVTTRREVA